MYLKLNYSDKRIFNAITAAVSSRMRGGAVILMIIGFIMAIVGNYNMWWGADSMIGVWGAIGILGLFMLIAGSVILSTGRHR